MAEGSQFFPGYRELGASAREERKSRGRRSDEQIRFALGHGKALLAPVGSWVTDFSCRQGVAVENGGVEGSRLRAVAHALL